MTPIDVFVVEAEQIDRPGYDGVLVRRVVCVFVEEEHARAYVARLDELLADADHTELCQYDPRATTDDDGRWPDYYIRRVPLYRHVDEAEELRPAKPVELDLGDKGGDL